MVGYRDWHCKLVLWGWILAPIALYLLVEGWPVGGSSLLLVRGAGFEVQLEGLGNGCHRLLNSLSANLTFSSCVSSSYPMGKGLDKGKLLWLWEPSKEGVTESEVGNKVGPVRPELLPCVVSLSHDPMGCCSRCSSAKTKEEIFVLRVCMCQEAFWERGNKALNLVRSASSVRSKLPWPPLRKDRLAKSAMLLLAPAMDQGARGELCVTRCRMDRALTKRWPTRDLLEERRRAQETVEVLSHQAAACLWTSVSVMCSRTR